MDHNLYDCLQNCPIEGTLRIIGGKWTGSLLWHLIQEPQRFNELQKLIPEASPKILSQRLKTLEDAKIIERIVLSTRPLAVQYRITDYGKTLHPIINLLSEWGINHRNQ